MKAPLTWDPLYMPVLMTWNLHVTLTCPLHSTSRLYGNYYFFNKLTFSCIVCVCGFHVLEVEKAQGLKCISKLVYQSYCKVTSKRRDALSIPTTRLIVGVVVLVKVRVRFSVRVSEWRHVPPVKFIKTPGTSCEGQTIDKFYFLVSLLSFLFCIVCCSSNQNYTVCCLFFLFFFVTPGKVVKGTHTPEVGGCLIPGFRQCISMGKVRIFSEIRKWLISANGTIPIEMHWRNPGIRQPPTSGVCVP